MKEKKKAPIILARRVMWLRFERINPRNGNKQTRLMQLWQRYDTGDLRLYLGTVRMDSRYNLRDILDQLPRDGWRVVAGGC